MKRQVKSIFLITLLLISFRSHSQWSEVYLDSTIDWISDIKFINPDTGYACGSGWPNGYGLFFRTTDGGINWDTTRIYGGWMMSLSSINDSTIYIGGQDAHIFKSTDGGLSWSFEGGFPCCPDQSSILYLNNDTAFSLSFFNGINRKTDGLNWNFYTLSGAHSYFPNNSSIQFLNSSEGFIAMKKIYKTANAGDSWQQLFPDTNHSYTSLFMKNQNEGTAVDDSGYVTHTADGGISWTSPQKISPYPLYDIAFVTDSIGYIIGGNDIYHAIPYWPNLQFIGVVYITLNGGNTWQLMQTFSHGLTSLNFINDSIGFAVGHKGRIIKITNANKVGVNEIISDDVFTLFPNPTNRLLTIKTSLLFPQPIEIFDLLGKNKFRGKIEKQEETINIEELENGIYILVFATSQGRIIKKLVVN